MSSENVSGRLKLLSCFALVLVTVLVTIFTEGSKSSDGQYPYNTFAIPCYVEALKLIISTLLLLRERGSISQPRLPSRPLKTSLSRFFAYAVPAACYFISNNCVFHVIKHLGAPTFQIVNNLKVLSTAMLMYLFLGKKLTWSQWKAMLILVVGSMVTQLDCKSFSESETIDHPRSRSKAYIYVLTSAITSSVGGVTSEFLLKKTWNEQGAHRHENSIHWNNVQLYFFGAIFGVLALKLSASGSLLSEASRGFNRSAYATVCAMVVSGLLVSFILKHLDNIAKSFVMAMSMLVVALLDGLMNGGIIPIHIFLGIVLTCLALEQYSYST